MAVDFGTLTTEILAITNRDSTYTSFVQNSILTAIKYMETEHPYFYEKSGVITILEDTNSTQLPSDLNQLIYAQYEIDGTIYGMRNGFQNCTYSDLLSYLTSSSDSGLPAKYALFSGNFYVYPMQNGDITFSLSYYYTDSFPPQIATDSSIWFGANTIDCVRAKAIENFYRYALQTPDLADRYQAGFENFLRNLRQRNNSQNLNNTLSI